MSTRAVLVFLHWCEQKQWSSESRNSGRCRENLSWSS